MMEPMVIVKKQINLSLKRLIARPIATLSLEAQECMKNLKRFIKKKNIKLIC